MKSRLASGRWAICLHERGISDLAGFVVRQNGGVDGDACNAALKHCGQLCWTWHSRVQLP